MTDRAIVNQDVFTLIDDWAPPHLAYDWDPVGLQVGARQTGVRNILVTLDVTNAVVDEAIEKGANLIIAHHPILFQPLKQIDTESVKGRLIRKLLTHDISVYAAHTNLDIASGGVNDLLCRKLDLHDVEILEKTGEEKQFKVVVYVPTTHEKELRKAMGDSGGGFIGEYSHCTFNTSGKGTFKPTQQADPYIGTANEIASVDETKIETIVPESGLQILIDAMLDAHPYEEAAYDLYELANKGPTNGIGRIGFLSQAMTLETLAVHVKEKLDVEGLRVVGQLSESVKSVAVLGGSGEKFIPKAMKQQADVLITGDLTFHPAQDALEAGMKLIDPGHHVEKVMKYGVKDYLANHLSESQIRVYTSKTSTEPFQFI